MEKDASKTIEHNVRKIFEHNVRKTKKTAKQLNKVRVKKKEIITYIPHFKACLDNLLNPLTTLLGKNIPSNLIMGKEQPSQVLLLTEIGGFVKLLVGITHPFRTHTENRNDPTIQPTTVHSNQVTGLVYSYRDHLPLSSLKSGTDVWIGVSGKNIHNRTGLNPKGPIGTIIPDTPIQTSVPLFKLLRGKWSR